jgi:hypothetical protein
MGLIRWLRSGRRALAQIVDSCLSNNMHAACGSETWLAFRTTPKMSRKPHYIYFALPMAPKHPPPVIPAPFSPAKSPQHQDVYFPTSVTYSSAPLLFYSDSRGNHYCSKSTPRARSPGCRWPTCLWLFVLRRLLLRAGRLPDSNTKHSESAFHQRSKLLLLLQLHLQARRL